MTDCIKNIRSANLFLLIPVFVFFFIFLSITNPASACSPAPGWPPSLKENFENSSVVFVGEVKSVVLKGEDFSGTFEITFDIEKSYKGDIAGTIVIETPASSAACGYDNADNFSVGSIFSIYADSNFTTNHLKLNKKHDSLSLALSELDQIEASLDSMKICTTEYAPVCGVRDTGIRCITTPCDSTEVKTYSNSCFMKVDEAEILHEGECLPEDGEDEQSPTIAPNNCKSWFDGCNECGRNSVGGPMACTLKYCFEPEAPICREYFSKDVSNDKPSTVDEGTSTVDTEGLDDKVSEEKVGIIEKFFNFIKNLFSWIF